jgi:dihydrofolate reductase
MSTTVPIDLFVSVDGWAGSDGSLPGYFGYLGPDLEKWIAAERAAPQISIMGRRTYELFARLPEQHRDEGWEQTTQQQTVVFSRTLTRVDWSNARVCSDDPAQEIGRLKANSDVAMRTIGSPSVARQLVSAGIADRIRLMTFPLLAGDAGRELAFTNVASAELELLDHRVLDGRVVLIEYRPTGKDIPRA